MSRLRESARPRSFAFRVWTLVASVLTLLAVALTPNAALAQGNSGQPSNGPTTVSATASTVQNGLGGAIPGVLAQAGVTPITLQLKLTDATGAAASFPTDAKFTLGVSRADGSRAHGTVTPSQVTLAANNSSGTWTFTYSAVENGVIVTPTLTGNLAKRYTLTTSGTQPFDSLRSLDLTATGPGATTVTTQGCSDGGSYVECPIVSLPQGTASSHAAATVGACTSELLCPKGSEVVGFYADLGTLYTKSSPAQITIRCDKARCGQGGIPSYTVKMTFDPTGPLDLTALPCISKGVADDGQGHDYCVDYRASTRDNAGDLLLVVNVVRDYRGAV